MAYKVVVPRLGLTMEEARIVEWYKETGEAIEKGEPLFSVETDKTVLDVEAPYSGIVHRVPNLPSDPLLIGHLIAYILQPGEEIPERPALSQTTSKQNSIDLAQESISTGLQETKSAPSRKFISPAARKRADELGVNWREIEHPSGKPILVTHVEEYAKEINKSERIKVSPLARRAAEDLRIDLNELAASMPGQTITQQDVEAFASTLIPTHASDRTLENEAKVIPLSMVRRTIAYRMAESAHSTAPVTLTTEADVSELVAWRENIKENYKDRNLVPPSYTDLIVKVVATALKDHPNINASLIEDKIVNHDGIHIGLAVDTDEGLLVPVIRDVPTKTILEISMESRALIERAHRRELTTEELQGGTFTITNLGTYGIDAFTPIINLPESAILGIGRIINKPAVFRDEVVPRKMMYLSLTFDHRVIDGGPAARFLNTVREYLEKPLLCLIS